jgi:hypothetical protein
LPIIPLVDDDARRHYLGSASFVDLLGQLFFVVFWDFGFGPLLVFPQ